MALRRPLCNLFNGMEKIDEILYGQVRIKLLTSKVRLIIILKLGHVKLMSIR